VSIKYIFTTSKSRSQFVGSLFVIEKVFTVKQVNSNLVFKYAFYLLLLEFNLLLFFNRANAEQVRIWRLGLRFVLVHLIFFSLKIVRASFGSFLNRTDGHILFKFSFLHVALSHAIKLVRIATHHRINHLAFHFLSLLLLFYSL